MESGRVDAVITNYTVYSDLLPGMHLTERVTILDPPGNQDFYAGIYLSQRALMPDVAKLIGRTVEAMHADGSLARLYQANTQAGIGDLFDFTAAPVDFSKCKSGKATCQTPTN
jgi:ABC-type amino acid transport substrate-binding protein